MLYFAALISSSLLAQVPAAGTEPEHAKNSVYQAICTVGLKADGAVARLAPPLLSDEMNAEQQRAVLLKLVESKKALGDFLEPRVTAPFKSKLHDWSGTSGTIRGFDIYFAIHSKLADLDPDDFAGAADKGVDADAGGMHFSGISLVEGELNDLGLTVSGKWDRFSKIECSMLDKVEAKMINRSLGTRSDASLVVASHTLWDLPGNKTLLNAWRSVDRRGEKTTFGAWQPFRGMIAYSKATRLLDTKPEAIFVEIHGAFSEPKGWFNGKGILKSKISIVANDKIRELRREIIKRKPRGAG
jgi:hypothetical protein